VPARVRHAAPVRSPRRFLQIAIPRRCLGGPWAPNHIAWDREFVREPWRGGASIPDARYPWPRHLAKTRHGRR
jgi:hypothetical protein